MESHPVSFIEKWWGIFAGGGSAGLLIAMLFRKALVELAIVTLTAVSESWGEWLKAKLTPKKKKNRRNHDVTIAALSQKVTDLLAWQKGTAKRLAKAEKRLEACQGERTECRADLRNLLMRISALERRKA